MSLIETVLNSIISFIFRLWPQSRPTPEQLKNCKIVAHRGVHENGLAKENTLQAFALAWQNKIWGVELDVRFTKDHVPVVRHDDITQHKIEPDMPTLEQVIAQFGRKLHLMIEIKEDLKNRPQDIAALRTVLRGLQPTIDYHLLTLNPDNLECIDFCPKSAFMDVIWLSPAKTFEKNDLLGHGAIAGHFLFIGKKTINRLKAQDKVVGVGFIDSRNSLYRELKRGVNFIFTDHPLRLNRILVDAKLGKR